MNKSHVQQHASNKNVKMHEKLPWIKGVQMYYKLYNCQQKNNTKNMI